jgi:hypothetical protein
LEAGLKPVHDNPVDLWLLKKQEVEKYIMAHSLINETRDAGLLQFVHAFMRAPMGWTKANDKAFEVWGPPSVTIKEAFDAGLREKTLEVLNHLGVPHERLARIRGKRWGYEADTGLPGSERIVSKFGGPDFILWHELGHALDNRYRDMRDTLTGPLAERNQLASYQMRKQPVPAALQRTEALNKEIRALADLRYEGQTTTPGFKQYVRSAPEKMAVALQAYIHAPERMKQVAPTVHGALRAFLASHPELNEINDIRPSLRLGEGETQMSVGGFIKLGDYYMPDPAARVLNNYLSPGLNHHLAYRTLRQTSNLLNGAQLGLSAFHLGFTSVDAAVSRLAVAIEDLSHGNLGSAVKTALSVPMAPFTNIRLGAKLRAEALEGRPSWVDRNLLRLSPGAQGTQIAQLVKALEAGGGRIGQDAFWRSEFSRRMVRAFHEGTATGYIKGAAHAPFALLEQTMRPILEYTVPRQKLGVFADIARRELERLGPNAAPEDVRASMRNAWDSVDNRMGQVVYDNLFYNRAVKDLALLSFRAYGWQLGKYRELGGAAWDVAKQGYELAHGRTPQMTHRMAYAMALPILVGAMGALTKYMLTGQGPQDLSEYYMIPTGEVDSKGRKVKVNLPSFVKDVISTWKHPLTSFTHTLNPLASEVMDQYQNRDFYGRRLFNPDDPLPRQLLDRGLALGKEFTPFSVSGALRLADDAAPLHKQVLPFFGITPVPARNLMSPAETVLAEAMSERMQGVGMPKETFDRAKLVREVVDGLKSKDAGRQAEAVGKAYDGIRSGAMSPSSTYAMIQKVGMTPFQFQLTHADTETAMRAWRVATPEERQQMHDRLLMKIVGSRKLGPEQKGKLLQEIGLERN